MAYQTKLSLIPDDAGPHEAQRVDLFVTRQWIRLLLWEYTSRHFAMACCPADLAFSLLLPVKIGHELLSLFSMVTDAAVKTHGYGMVSVFFQSLGARNQPWSKPKAKTPRPHRSSRYSDWLMH